MTEMPPPNPFERIAQFYDNLVNRYGHDPRACDYGRAQSQLTKFRVLAEVIPLENKRVLDVGCGFADYADYLHERFGSVTYMGIDLSPGMIETAKHLHPALDLRVGNILREPGNDRFDVVTANGIFYLLGCDAPDLMRLIIRRMFDLACIAAAFNSLSAWATAQEAGEFYAHPLETVEFCRTITPWVVLRHDYLPHDFTIYMYREPQDRCQNL
jgi:SAM-dependent methyltransferase